jgi:predicted glutamine amidotransferase
MCRLFGAAASAPINVRFELLESDNSVLRQSERHDSGWGCVFYRDHEPTVRRFPVAAHEDAGFTEATTAEGDLIVVHVRRATVGGLSLANTHPFTDGPYSYCHNGTILKAAQLEPLARRRPAGDTDSERFFNLLMEKLDPEDIEGTLRETVREVCRRCKFSALNLLLCDGRRLYAYRFGVYELFWLVRNTDLDADTKTHYHLHMERPRGEHVVLVASERLTDDEPWTPFEQDELLVCDPADPNHPRLGKLLGDEAAGIEFEPLDAGALTGAARGEWAARRAAEGF